MSIAQEQAAKDFIHGRLAGIDHITIPVKDLDVAERFYAGVLGARVVARPDWEAVRSGRNKAPHLSVMIGDGPRVDLFLQPYGQPELTQSHPHTAFRVRDAQDMLQLKEALAAHGVLTYGPTRLGPPGQASLYFLDPFGNHLEFETDNLHDVPVGPPDHSKLHSERTPGSSRN